MDNAHLDSNNEVSVAASSVPVYCHICEQESMANATLGGELECVQCQTTFVEALGQDLEGFVATSSVPSIPTTDTTSTLPHTVPLTGNFDAIIENMIGRALGLQLNQSSGIASTIRSAGRPVDIIMNNRTAGTASTAGVNGPLSNISGLINSLIGNRLNEDTNVEFERLLHHILMNEQSHAGAPPAESSVIDSLPRKTISGDEACEELGECLISFEKFSAGDIMLSLPCGHNYKEDQILQWLRMHGTCPVCRISITSTSTEVNNNSSNNNNVDNSNSSSNSL